MNGFMQIHKTNSSEVNLMMHIFNEDNDTEIPFTFTIDSTAAKANAPANMRVSGILDVSANSVKISIRIRSDSSNVVFGVLSSDVPTGSQNHSGLLEITRIG